VIREVRKALERQKGSGSHGGVMTRNLLFYVTAEGLVPSCIVYDLDRARLSQERPLLRDLIDGFLGVPEEAGEADAYAGGILALVEPSSPGFDLYPLVSRDCLPMLTKSYRRLRNQSDRLSFTD
jgi:hypothetical protein